jgi:hypothetical protein
VNGTVMAMPRRSSRWHLWLPVLVVVAAGLGALVWRLGPRSERSFNEYPILAKTDIPTALDIGPNGAVWFTIEFSDAIGVFRNGKIDRISKGPENLEPLGLAADGAGGAWYTDTPMRAISHISSDGTIQSFRLSSPIVRLGRLAIAPDGAVWFGDITTASVTRLKDGMFIRHDVSSLGATPYGIAVDPAGVVWTTLQGADQLGWLSTDGQVTALDVPTRNSGLGDISVDRGGRYGFSSCGPTKLDGLPRSGSPSSCFPHLRPGLPRWLRLLTGRYGSPSLVSANSADCEAARWPNFACPVRKAAHSAWRSMRPIMFGTPTSAGGWGCCRRARQRLHRRGSADRGHDPPRVRR